MIELDVSRSLIESQGAGHNRWHPDVPPVAHVQSDSAIAASVRDGLDGQITKHTQAVDLARFDMLRAHPLTGPIYIEDAEPGDVLDVGIQHVEPGTFGATVVLPGFGMLGDLVTEPFVARWTLSDGTARSDDIPTVRIPGAPFLGVIGVAPSASGLALARRQEAAAARTGTLVLEPTPQSAVPGAPAAIGSSGLRTIPPREWGGNLDVKQLRAGSVVTLPVAVPGALLSIGDPHFAQGDGECCGFAIETTARATIHVMLRKGASVANRHRSPIIRYTDAEADPQHRRDYLATTGLAITKGRRDSLLDLTLAARNALEEMSTLLISEFGLTFNQAYVVMSVAVDLRVGQGVNTPTALVTASLPLGIFR